MTATKGPRIDLDVARGEPFEIVVDGVAVAAHAGETVAAVLLTIGVQGTRRSTQLGEPRGYFCGMGICWECVVHIDGDLLERACMQQVRPGMRVDTDAGESH